MPQVYITKSITASSSNTLGIFSTNSSATAYSSGASFSVGTSTGSVAATLDSARRIILWSSTVDASSLLITLTGTNEGGRSITETLAGSTTATAPRATTQDFLSITSVSFSSGPPIESRMHLGTNTQAGSQWKVTDTSQPDPFNLSAGFTFSSTISTTLASLECTLDDVTQTNPAPTRALSTNPATVIPFTPTAFISQTAGSTLLSSAAASVGNAFGNITTAIAAYRVTLTSSSSTAGGVFATVVQAGA